MEKSEKKKIKVFLDASVIIAAVISQSGGSFRILTEAATRGFLLITCRYAFKEAEINIQNKYFHLLSQLYNLSNLFNFVADADKKSVEKCLKLIDFKDAPVLASAIKEKSDILITLDKKHFINNPKLKNKNSSPEILTPANFIKKYFK